MSISSTKKILLAGTALVAAATLAPQAQAADISNGSGTWASAATHDGNGTNTADATAGDNIDIGAGQTLTVTNNQVADDSSGLDTFILGNVTNNGGTGVLTIAPTNGNPGLSVTIGSASVSTFNQVTPTGNATNAADTTITGALTLSAGNLTLTNNNATGIAAASSLSVGSIAVTVGTTAITAGAGVVGSTETLTVQGTSSFNGLVTVTSTAGAADYAALDLKGASNTLTAGINLVGAGASISALDLTGSAAQTVTGGDIKSVGNLGILQINNSAGVTIENTVGVGGALAGIRINQGAGDSSATFKGATVDAPITLGGAAGTIAGVTYGAATAGDTNTVIFDSSDNAIAQTGVIAGANGTQTNNIAVMGGSTVTFGSADTTHLHNLNVSDSGTILSVGAGDFTLVTDGQAAGTTGIATVGAGATLEVTGNTFTAPAIVLGTGSTGGTLTMAGGAVTGAVDGSATDTGTLSVTSSGTLTGNIGGTNSLHALNIATGATLTTSTGSIIKATTTTLTGTGTLTVANTGADLTMNIVSAADTDGTLNTGTGAVTETGNIGTDATHRIGTVAVGAGGDFSTNGNIYANAVTIGAGGSLSSTGGALSSTTITIGNGSTLSATGDVSATSITAGNAASTLELKGTAAQTVSGTYGTGILQVGDGAAASNVTFSSILGGAALASLDVEAQAAATFNAAVTSAGAFTSSGTSTFAATAASSTGAITNAATGTINITGTGGLSTGANAINNAGIINLTGGNLTTTGAFTNTAATGTVNISTGKALNVGSVATGTGANTFNFEVKGGSTITNGTNGLLASTAGVDLTGATVTANIDPTSTIIPNYAQFKVVTSTGVTDPAITGTPALVATVGVDKFYAVLGGSALAADFGGGTATGTGNDVVLISVQQSLTTLGPALTDNDSSVYSALSAIGTGGGADLTTIEQAINAAANTSDTALHNVLQTLTPTVDGSAQIAALDIVSDAQDVTASRMMAMRDGDTSSGVAAGSSSSGVSMWIQGYGQHAKQNERDGINGYSANSYGGTVGADTTSLLDRGILGFALNYGQSRSNSENANTTTTRLNSYGAALYANYDFSDRTFVTAQGGYAYNKIYTYRHDVGGVGGPTAAGDTAGAQWTARADIGHDFRIGGGMTLTPDFSADYSSLKTEGYSETGAGGADLTIGSNTLQVLNLGVGTTASWKIKDIDGDIFKPSLHLGYAYDAIGDTLTTTSSFAGDPGVSFVTTGASPLHSTYDAGAKFTYMSQSGWDLSATYDLQIKPSYVSNTGQARLTAHF